ncbi:MAG TPA: gluconate 2-dehydrogenase subunit 3 family protein [Acidobacteriaceae bacterium]|nr:gluconate 2-dehydrogenase subunit 3 family protein [Acidobacteriaceae bacterium]
MKRREFIMVPAKALSGLLLSSLVGELIPAVAQDAVKLPLRFFTAQEAKTVQAAAQRIFPSDESGPGATEAGVVIYIDRQLAGPYGKDKYRYTKGPWIESVPEHGYQGKENPQQTYRAGIPLLGDDFSSVLADQQDMRLEKIQDSRFFQLLRSHTIEGMFCDPLHGGNIEMVGWKLIGFPGPRMSYRYEIDKYHGKAFTAAPRSLEQILRHPVKGVEDEE